MVNETRKPRIFVGSSSEHLDEAYAIQENLDRVCEVTVWTQGIFRPSRTALTSLIRRLSTFDFAVFAFAPDDLLFSRGTESQVVRDNIIFELGLFIGEFGEDRTFIIVPRDVDELHLPTDLVGLEPVYYEANRTDNNLVAALGPACTQIKREIDVVDVRHEVSEGAVSALQASGLSEELKHELIRLREEQNSDFERALERFENRIASAANSMQIETRSPVSSLREVVSGLSSEAIAILKAISVKHLDYDQFWDLANSELRLAISELRDHNLIGPLKDWGVGSTERPVYWFQSRNLRNILIDIANSDIDESNAVVDQVDRILHEIGYLPLPDFLRNDTELEL